MRQSQIAQSLWVFDCDGTLYCPQNDKLYLGIFTLLRDLKKRGAEVVIWTLRERASCLRLLKDFQIAHFVDEMYCGDDRERKPHPSPELVAWAKNSSSVYMVGDSFLDGEAAEILTATFLVAAWSESGRGLMNSSRSGHFCASPQEVINLWNKLEGLRSN